MRFISTRMHAVMDYATGALLIAVPLLWQNDTAVPSAAVWTPVAIGSLMLMQSLFTDYEFSIANVLAVSAHLRMDAIAGVLLAASPWLFGFAETVWVPHVIVGILEIAAAFFTKLHRSNPANRTTGNQVPA